MYENKIIFRIREYTAKKEYSGPIPWGFRRNVPYFNIKIIIRRKMIEKIVNNLVKNLLKIEIIKSEEKVLYEYGIRLLLTSIFNSIWIIGVAAFLGYPILGVIYSHIRKCENSIRRISRKVIWRVFRLL